MTRVLAAIVVPPHLTVSGGARAAEALSQALSARCDMTVASMLGGEADAGRNDAVPRRLPVRVSLPPGLSLSAVPRRFKTLFYRSDIPRMVRRGGFDLVHLHNPMPALEMARIARACRAAGIPYVVSTHGFNEVVNGLEIYGFGRVGRAVWRRLVLAPVREVVAGAAEIFALSPADLSSLATLGCGGARVRIVPNGIAAPTPRAAEEDVRLLSRLGIAPRGARSAPTFMFLANHTPNKGLGVLFDALARLSHPFQVILGGERRPNVPYDAAVATCRPGQRIVVTGRLSDDEVAACFRRADAFVFPTLADTFPLVVLEAMSHGIAVVASDVGGIPHQLAGGCGLLVAAGDAAALAGALVRLIDEPGLAAGLALAAATRVSSEFTWSKAAAAASDGYAEVMSRQRTVAAGPEVEPSATLRRRAF